MRKSPLKALRLKAKDLDLVVEIKNGNAVNPLSILGK
jgi:hypothetical protein